MIRWILRCLPHYVVLTLLLLVVGLAGCQTVAQIDAPPVATGPTVMPTIMPTAFVAAAVSPTHLPGVTETPLSSVTPALSPTRPRATTTAQAATAAPSPAPTRTPIPSSTPTPTAAPQWVSPLAVPTPRPDAVDSRDVPIPTAVPTYELPAGTTNILLLGTDIPLNAGTANTDTILIVSVNTRNKTATLLSLPRDLYVYIPGWRMANINQAMPRGDAIGYPTGPLGQLKDTILYNFGVPIHYTVEIDFAGFKQIVDALGGVEIAVGCSLTDWRLKSPDLDIHEEENWERFTLTPGIHQMDGDLALWYVRSRLTTSDFDRNRRQQQILRALLNKGIDLNLIKDVPTLWATYQQTVRTDLDIGRILQLATAAAGIRQNGIQHLHLRSQDMIQWRPPNFQQDVFLVNGEMAGDTVQRLFTPASLNRANRVPIYVELINHTDNPDMALLAADNLAWQGFAPIISPDQGEVQDQTEITYYGTSFKGSYDWLLSWVLDQPQSRFLLNQDDDAYAYNYRVVLGADFNPCRRQQYAPRENLTPPVPAPTSTPQP